MDLGDSNNDDVLILVSGAKFYVTKRSLVLEPFYIQYDFVYARVLARISSSKNLGTKIHS